MKTILTHLLAAFVVCSVATQLRAQGTAFTYQGRLNSTSGAATGTYDFAFAIYDATASGNLIAGPITNSAVSVSNGLFSTTIDFGSAPFDGSSRWLDISVRTNGATTFFNLSPRQAFTPSPYSITAATITGPIPAAQITGTVPSTAIAGTYNNAVTLNNANNQFAGTYSGNGAGVTNVNAATLNGLASSSFWQVGGNQVVNGQFIGSTNNVAVEMRAGGKRVALYTPTTVDSPNITGGAPANLIDNATQGAVIAGGGTTNYQGHVSINHVTGSFSTIGGGSGNWIQSGADHSFIGAGWSNYIQSGSYESVIAGGQQQSVSGINNAIGGGWLNAIAGSYSTIAGGSQNSANGTFATIGGGQLNTSAGAGTVAGGTGGTAGTNAAVGGGYQNSATGTGSVVAGGGFDNMPAGNTASGNGAAIGGGSANTASALLSTIVGGNNNVASNSWSTVGGGQFNVAGGTHSFAAGRKAVAAHNGSFVWADETDTPFATTAANQFLVRASGGVGINDNTPNGASLSVSGNRNGGFATPVGYFENTSTANASPALRVLGNGNPPDGVLSVSSSGTGLIARFGNASSWVADITTNGTFEGSFSGNGAGLNGVTASQLAGGTYANAITFNNPANLFTGSYTVASNANLRLNDRPMFLRGSGDPNHGLAYCGNGITNFGGGGVQVDGPVLWGYSGGALGVSAGTQHAIMNWNGSGINVSGNANISGNLSANNNTGVSWSQYGGTFSDFTSSEVSVDSEGNYKPAIGYFFISAFASIDCNGNTCFFSLYDVSGSPSRIISTSASGGQQTVSLTWVVPVTSAGGYQNFQTTLFTDGGTSTLFDHNLTVIFVPRHNN